MTLLSETHSIYGFKSPINTNDQSCFELFSQSLTRVALMFKYAPEKGESIFDQFFLNFIAFSSSDILGACEIKRESPSKTTCWDEIVTFNLTMFV